LTTRVIAVDPDRPDPAALDEAALVLGRGGLVAFATETVYGLGGIATDAGAVARIFAAKGRPAINPLIVHAGGVGQVRECVAVWPAEADKLARRFWPGPLTLVLPRSEIIPEIVTAGRSTVGVRVPAATVALGLVGRSGRPIAAPSANRSNRISPTRADHVLADLDGRIDLVLDSGPTTIGVESTVVDLTTSPPRVLRPGPITAEELGAVLAVRVEGAPGLTAGAGSGAPGEGPMSPGQMPVHYAPRTPAFRVESTDALLQIPASGTTVLVVLGVGDGPDPGSFARAHRLESPELAARMLYEVLHECDQLSLGAILVVMPPETPEWQAVRDRILRATRPLGE
jgi:L-threonylcarbamoyladenylate synthase